jgi:hypothetical protein
LTFSRLPERSENVMSRTWSSRIRSSARIPLVSVALSLATFASGGSATAAPEKAQNTIASVWKGGVQHLQDRRAFSRDVKRLRSSSPEVRTAFKESIKSSLKEVLPLSVPVVAFGSGGGYLAVHSMNVLHKMHPVLAALFGAPVAGAAIVGGLAVVGTGAVVGAGAVMIRNEAQREAYRTALESPSLAQTLSPASRRYYRGYLVKEQSASEKRLTTLVKKSGKADKVQEERQLQADIQLLLAKLDQIPK